MRDKLKWSRGASGLRMEYARSVLGWISDPSTAPQGLPTSPSHPHLSPPFLLSVVGDGSRDQARSRLGKTPHHQALTPLELQLKNLVLRAYSEGLGRPEPGTAAGGAALSSETESEADSGLASDRPPSPAGGLGKPCQV